MKRTLLMLVTPLLVATAPHAFNRLQPAPLLQTPPKVEEPTPLRDAFKGKLLIGTAVPTGVLQGRDEATEKLVRTHFSILTAENAMKPDAIQPREGEFTFADADRLVELAKGTGAKVVGHTLIWHGQTPRWFFEGKDGQPVTREVALARLRQHIKTVVGRYKGRVKEWDVVNEAINDGPGVLRNTPWFRAIGEDYIAEAFRAAHEADPDALLIYNDYNIEQNYKRPKALELLKKLVDQKVPIHGVGIQAHWRMPDLPLGEAEQAIKEFSALGLKVMFTELDLGVLPTRYQGADISRTEGMTPEQEAVMNPYTKGLPNEVAQKHAEKYGEAFKLFLRYPNVVTRVTFWGAHDGMSWLNNFPVRGRTDYPLLFDRELKPKPAFFAVQRTAGSAARR